MASLKELAMCNIQKLTILKFKITKLLKKKIMKSEINFKYF